MIPYDREKLIEDYRQYRERMKQQKVTRDFSDMFMAEPVVEGTVGAYKRDE